MTHSFSNIVFRVLLGSLAALVLAGAVHAASEPDPWWNAGWSQRAKVTLDTGGDAAGLTESAGGAAVLVRLHEGNFQFPAAREDGSDIRFIAADGKTVLPHQIEKYDGLLNEAFIWVKLPEVKPATKEFFHIYYGNADPAMAAATKPAETFDAQSVLVFHFGERGAAPADATSNANHAETIATNSDGSLIGSGLRLSGAAPVVVPAKPSLQWQAGQSLTLTVWVKPTALQPKAVIAGRTEGSNAFRLLLDQGIPLIEISGGAAPAQSEPGTPVAAGKWTHLAVVAEGSKLQLFVNGVAYGQLTTPLPALNSPLLIGGLAPDAPVAGTTALVGELDEFTLSKTARSAAWVKLAAINQGNSDAAQRTISLAQTEGGEAGSHSGVMEHLALFGDIAGNMMFDGWMAIGVCVIMIIVGWTVAIRKFLYLNSIETGTQVFLAQWKSLSTDLTALDTEDTSSVKSLGGQVTEAELPLIHKSPLFHIYQIGSDEIRHRLDKDNTRVNGLTGRSIQAIRASLDAGLVHETHRLTDGLIYLTISIAGGPYVGLLGTVVGVMITFAIIAKSGEVNVNSIAPGIASALLATVVGLVVAIPALFIYSYLNSRIKNSLSLMQVFIDEFVAKMAEFYRPPNEPDAKTGKESQ
jgi:biopolymer transport protein ExbB